jgi:eukaryotic-like serine/threonine-protein kinase
MALTVENICGLLIRSRLLPPEAVKTLFARWQGETKGRADAGAFTQWLVAKEYVTKFQATLIARGVVDNFFLNDYKLIGRIRHGPLKGLYKAVHNSGPVVALKVLPPSRAKNADLLARFQAEARLAMRLKHPHIARTFQMGEARGAVYLALEYLEGETLEEVVKRRGRLPPEEAVRLIYQALLGLQHLFDQDQVHRNLKPANLLLVPEGKEGQPDTTLQSTVKILDPHLTKALVEGANSEGGDNSSLAIIGNPDYLAPELARDPANGDIRSDIYSLGCVLYQVLTGQPPFPDNNPIGQMIRHATESPRPLAAFNAEIPDGLQQILGWMMAKDPAQRYPTPQRAAQALQVFLVAGSEVTPKADSDAGMKPYLQWLERGTPGPGDSQKVAAAPDHGKKTKRHWPSDSQSEAPAAPEPATTWDVELVPGLPLQEIAFSFKGFVLTRRDLLMLAIGGAGIAAGGLIGMTVAKLAGAKDSTGKTPPGAGEEKPKDGE